jgi:hypothetical protein
LRALQCPFGHRVPSFPSRMAKSTPRAGIHLRSWIALPQCGEVAFDGRKRLHEAVHLPHGLRYLNPESILPTLR